jgi:hypothetical protein
MRKGISWIPLAASVTGRGFFIYMLNFTAGSLLYELWLNKMF